ncbi:peptidase S8/S53 domain-containing protein [Chytridium lagenaria]|nr:peptidase S8/S53 domain-containing protein [Chytridium lagenaria]
MRNKITGAAYSARPEFLHIDASPHPKRPPKDLATMYTFCGHMKGFDMPDGPPIDPIIIDDNVTMWPFEQQDQIIAVRETRGAPVWNVNLMPLIPTVLGAVHTEFFRIYDNWTKDPSGPVPSATRLYKEYLRAELGRRIGDPDQSNILTHLQFYLPPRMHLSLILATLLLLITITTSESTKYPSSKLKSVANQRHSIKVNFAAPEQAKKAAENKNPEYRFINMWGSLERVNGREIVERHLRESGGLKEDDIMFRTVLDTDIFNGCRFRLMRMLIRRVKRIRPFRIDSRTHTKSGTDERSTPSDLSTLHALTGVLKARKELGLTGKGIKIAIIDSGVYHLHPALGVDSGQEEGYDLVGDYYVDESSHPQPDDNPLDDCSVESHGTHVAGIIGADAKNITKEGFVPPTPFEGVAPGATLGAYRVFGCGAESTSTDILMKALYMAHLDGADVINMSLTPEALRNSEIVDDGCQGPKLNVTGKLVIYAFQNNAGCTSYVRFRKAFEAGAAACLQYDNSKVADGIHRVVGFKKLVGGSVTRAVAEELLKTKEEKDDAKIKLTLGKYEGERLFSHATKAMAGRMIPAGRVSGFSSPGLRGDLMIKPDIGAPGANILSTVSPKAASKAGMPWSYNLMSGTLALYLEAKGMAKNRTKNEESLKQERAEILTAFANTARPARWAKDLKRYNSVALQGAGLVDVYSAITSLSTVTPHAFSLNDTEHAHVVHNITVKNNHQRLVTYTIESDGAATAFPFLANGKTMPDEVLEDDVAPEVKFSKGLTERSFSLKAGESRTIKLAFIPPSNAASNRFPIYSGYVRVTSDATDMPITIPYAGISLKKSDPAVTGVFDWVDSSVTGGRLSLVKAGSALNASDGIMLKTVLASPSRLARIEVVRVDAGVKNEVGGDEEKVEGLVVLDPDDASAAAEFHFVARNTRTDGDSVFAENTYMFTGEVTKDGVIATRLPEGQYKIKFSALKHVGVGYFSFIGFR